MFFLLGDEAAVKFIDYLLPDEEYVERQRRKAERDLGRLDEELVMHIRIISAAPEDQRSELHRMACRALMCGYKCDMTTEILDRAVRARCGIISFAEFIEWCSRRFGAANGTFIATGGNTAMIN